MLRAVRLYGVSWGLVGQQGDIPCYNTIKKYIVAPRMVALTGRANKQATKLPISIRYVLQTLMDEIVRCGPGQGRSAVHLKGVRIREHLTQIQLAEQTGIAQRHINEMETGKQDFGKENAGKLAAALNADCRFFYKGSVDRAIP